MPQSLSSIIPMRLFSAGGVAVSGLEMAQNSQRLAWTAEEVENRLHGIMKSIHHTCQKTCERYGLDKHDYVAGANIAGFVRVAEAMLAQGNV